MKRSLVAQPVAAALGLLYEEELAAALAAVQRKDNEALHDFRVALRRLAVLVQQFARPDEQRRTLLRTIKGLMTESNQGRDAQVMLIWLAGEWPRLDEQERIGAQRWQRALKRLQGVRSLAPKQASAALKSRVHTLGKLSPQDSSLQLPLGLLAAQCLVQQVNELGSLMKDDDAVGQLHFIRLKAKTVRYLLLPFCDESPDCVRALEALQRLQTQLGEWHDAVVRQQSLIKLLCKEVVTISCNSAVKGAMESVAERSPALPGLLALARSNYMAQQRLVASINHNYLREGHAHLTNLLQQAITELKKAATAHG